jgi:hypothetical protein
MTCLQDFARAVHARASGHGYAYCGTLLLLTAASVHADQPPPASVLSSYESADVRVDRDCGFSRQISETESLWLFCDTASYTRTGGSEADPIFGSGAFVPGTTAARSTFLPGLVPDGLSELPTPGAPPMAASADAAPQRFLPNPSGLTRGDGTPCTGDGTYQAAWATGTVSEPDSGNLLISYNEVCVVAHDADINLYGRGVGIAEYDPRANQVTRATTLYRTDTAGSEVPPQWQLGSPIIKDGVLYLFASECTRSYFGVCDSGSIYVANTYAAAGFWDAPDTYHWWDGTIYPGWTTDFRAAASLVEGAKPLSISVDSYGGKGLALIVQNDIGGGYTVWRSPSGEVLGPWQSIAPGPAIPGCDKASGLDLCRALFGHPELSSDSQLLMSYYSPGVYPQQPTGHVQVLAVPW